MKTIIDKLLKSLNVGFKEEPTMDMQIEILLKPLVVVDKAMELFYDLPSAEFRFQEKMSYKICKREFDKFFSAYYKELSLEERYQIDDCMNEFSENINNEIVLLDMAFQSMLMFLDTHKRTVVCKLYVINILTDCVGHMIQSMKTKRVDLKAINQHIYKLQKAYFTRAYPHRCVVDTNANDKIRKSVESFITKMLDYKIKTRWQ